MSTEHTSRATEQGTTAAPRSDDGDSRVQVPPLPVPDAAPMAANGAHAGNGSGPTGEPRFRTLEEHESDVVAVVSAEGRFLFVSASAETLLGYDISNAIGQDAFRLLESLSVDPVRALFDDLVARRRLSLSLELETTRADGSAIDLEVVAANHLDDPIGGIVLNIRDITERKRLEQRVRAVDRRQDVIVESLADGLIMVDAAGRIVRVNEAFEVLFSVPRIRLLGRRLLDVLQLQRAKGLDLFDEDGETVDDEDHPVLVSLRRGRRVVGVVLGFRDREGPSRWVRVNAAAIIEPDGTVGGAVGSISDITGPRAAAYALHQEERFLQVLLDTLDEGIVACDAEGRITVFNPAARRLHGLAGEAEPVGWLPSSSRLRRADGSPLESAENPLLMAMSGERLRDVEILLESDDGGHRKVSVNGQALVDDDGWKLGAVVAMHDVTEQKRNEERLAELALHDPLTGLANRALLAERLQEAIDSLARSVEVGEPGRAVAEHSGVAVYLLDLDEFKEINDALGHEVGDEMLVAVARRLSAIVRPSDTVARLGGDEFVIVCDIESGEDEMLRIGERISEALAQPYRIEGRTLVAEASVGGVFADNPDTDPSKLLSRADDAMYGVKWSRRRHRRSMTD